MDGGGWRGHKRVEYGLIYLHHFQLTSWGGGGWILESGKEKPEEKRRTDEIKPFHSSLIIIPPLTHITRDEETLEKK